MTPFNGNRTINTTTNLTYCDRDWYYYSGYCYQYNHQEKHTWLSAKTACVEKDSNLLSIRDDAEMNVISHWFYYHWLNVVTDSPEMYLGKRIVLLYFEPELFII